MKIAINGDAHWHELRAKHIGGSEIASLFNTSENKEGFLSKFQLHTIKAGKATYSDFGVINDRMDWGNFLEEGIARGIAEKEGFTNISKSKSYYFNENCEGMGCTPDFYVTDNHGQVCLLQIKNIDWLQFKKWENEQPPLKYVLQAQHELACTRFTVGYLGVLIGGNEHRLYRYEWHNAAIAKIEHAVEEFWHNVHNNIEPQVTGDDLDILKHLFPIVENVTLDLTGDNELGELCDNALEAAQRRKEAEKQEKTAKARIMEKVGNANYAWNNEYSIKRSLVHKKESYVKASDYVKLSITKEGE